MGTTSATQRRTSAISGLLLLTLASACASTAPTDGEQQPLFFPLPPAAPRVQYLTWASGSDQVVGQKGALRSFALGANTGEEQRITKPYGLAVRDGVVYVCDTKFPSIARMDFKEHTYSLIGADGPGRLRKPINIAIDSLGYKFVADILRKQIIVFGPDDKFAAALDLPENCHAVDLAVRGNELFVLDNDDTPGVIVMDRTNGTVLRSFGSLGQEPGQFHVPNSLCIDPDGFIYISDTLNYRVQKLTPEGEPIWERGNAGYQLGQFGRPRGIRCGPDGVVYVVEGAMQLVQMYNGEGDVLMRFGGPGTIPGSMVLPATIAIDKTSIPVFEQYIHDEFQVEYLLFVTNQYGERLVNVYAFGAFPEGYRLDETGIATLAPLEAEGIGAVAPDSAIPEAPSAHELPPAPPTEEPGTPEDSAPPKD